MCRYFIILGLLLALSGCQGKKFNYPRLLLPIFDEFSVNFTLEVIERGCFNWKVNRPDLIRITPLYEDEECSYQAIVTPISRERVRNTPLVLAEEVTSGEVLRCDVILDVIHEIEVFTTTRELYLQEAPEKFELKALDVFGNAFSSLEGVQFRWEINANAKSVETEILRFLKFADSSYHEVPETMAELEQRDETGYMILLDGLNTGTAKVSVRLPYSEYSNVPAIKVDIMVLANILIDPSEVSILVGDRARFQVLQLTQGRLTDISTNNQYYLELERPEVAGLEVHMATGLKLGRTLVLLRDKNVAAGQQDNVPTAKATLNVVTPTKLIVDLLPHYNWITLEGEYHDIVFTLVTADEQRITMSDRFQIDSKIPADSFRVEKAVWNGTHNYGQAIKAGKSAIMGQFAKLSTQAELQTFKRIELTPKRVILPFDPASIARPNRIQFIVQGGDGNFIWSIDNKQMATIDNNGLAETRLNEQMVGMEAIHKATVKVAMRRNPKLFETAAIVFLEPIKLELIEYNIETAVDDYVHVQVVLYAESDKHPGELLPISDCSALKFELEFNDMVFKQQVTGGGNVTVDADDDSCQVITLKAINTGRTQFRVTYKFQDRVLTDVIQLIVFEPLGLLYPVVGELILPIGSSQNIIFANGPEKLFHMDAELTKELTFNRAVVKATEISVPSSNNMNLNVFNVLCKTYGNTNVHLRMSNQLSTGHRYRPYVFEYVLRVMCLKPRFLNLISRTKVQDSCPMNSKINSIVEVGGGDEAVDEEKEFIEIEVEVSDVNNHKMVNITSLEIVWRLLESSGDTIENFQYVETPEVDLIENVAVSNAFLLKLNKNLQSSMKRNFKLIGTLIGYDEAVMRSGGVTPDHPAFAIQKTATGPKETPLIEAALNFMVINATLLPVDRVTVYVHSTYRLPILQGSGYYAVTAVDRSKITVQLDGPKNEIVITPKEVGDTMMIVTDRCLGTLRQEVMVTVVAIDRIELRVSDRVETGKTVEAIARLHSSNDYLDIDHSNLVVYELSTVILNADILQMELATDQRNLQRGEIKYKVTGLRVGETKVSVKSGTGVSSAPPNIVQVFSPLQLYPKNSTILIGTSIQIHSRGGPQPDVGIELMAVDEKILRVSDSTMVHGLRLGESTVIGRCVAFDPTTGSTISFSDDSVLVNVVPLDGIKIVAPLSRIIVGAVMPAAIWALPNIPPSVLGTLADLKVYWSTNQPDIVEVFNIFAPLGVEYSELDAISVRVRALKEGKAQLYAKVVTPNGKVLQSSIQITVLNDLQLIRPKALSTAGTILAMPPNSEFQLKANVEETQFKLEPAFGGKLLNVTENGVVRSGDLIGYALVMATSSIDQQLPILVRIKNIHYIMATLDMDGGQRMPVLGGSGSSSSTGLQSIDSKLPQGLMLKLKITFHDNVGNEIMHSWNAVEHLKYALSHRAGLNVQIENDFALSVSLLQETSNILAIRLRASKLNVKYSEDFIKLSVAQSSTVFPLMARDVVSTGDVVCFESLVGQPSKWASSEPGMINIEEATGVGVVTLNRGTAAGQHVIVTNAAVAHTLAVKFDMDVRQVDHVEFRNKRESFGGNGELRAYFVMRNRMQSPLKTTNVVARNVTKCLHNVRPFDVSFVACRAVKYQDQNLDDAMFKRINVKAGFDTGRGQYYCSVTLVDYATEWSTYLRKNSVLMSIEVNLKGMLDNGSGSGALGATELHLIAGLNVTPRKLVLAKETDVQELVIVGRESYLKEMQVVASHANLEVKRTTNIGQDADGNLGQKYSIQIVGPIDEAADFLSVSIALASTSQNITVPVEVPLGSRKCATQPFYGQNILSSIVANLGLIISTVIIGTVCLYVGLSCSSKNYYTNPEVFQNSQNTSQSQQHYQHPNQSTMSSSSGSPARNMSSTFNQSSNGSFPVYGDISPISPQRRINRRFM